MTYSNLTSKKNPLIPLSFTGIIGDILPPDALRKYTGGEKGQGLFTFISNVIKLAAVLAGLLMIIQFIMAGYDFINAQGDSKKIETAWTKIWQSIIGIVIIASAFALAGLIERLTGLNIINPEIHGP